MQCVICKSGTTAPGTTTAAITRGETTVVVKGVPADVCQHCGKSYYSDAVAEAIERMVGDAVSSRVELRILRYAA